MSNPRWLVDLCISSNEWFTVQVIAGRYIWRWTVRRPLSVDVFVEVKPLS